MLDRVANDQPRTSVKGPLGHSLKVLWSRIRSPEIPRHVVMVLMFFGVLLPESASIHFLGINSPVWLTNAVAVAILFRSPPATWPCLLLVQFLADLFSGVLVGDGVFIGLGTALSDSVEVLETAAAFHVIARRGALFSDISRISLFAAVCLTTPAFSAIGNAFLLHATLGLPWDEVWINWYLSATFGLLILTPFLLMWTEPGRFSTASPWVRAEIILLTVVVGAVGWIDFSVQALPGLFLSFPFLIVAAFRGGLLGATGGAVALVVVATSLTLTGHGEIANSPDTTVVEHVLVLQLYFGAILLSSLPVAVMLEQRKLLTQFKTVAELSRMARHDTLTKLPNRLMFQERLAWTQAEARRQGGHTALLMIDLDRFKPVNDLYGHAAGDRLLFMVADRLRASARETDTVARLGGDEFAIVGHVAEQEMAQPIAERVIAALSEPFSFMDLTVHIGCSIGIALSPADGIAAEALVKRADAALYRAKEEGRNTFRYFQTGMDDAVRQRAELEVELRKAIQLDQVIPRYQPIVTLDGGQVAGFEMLARWRHPTLGEVPPSALIPLAESLGLIGTLFERLLRQACTAAVGWPDGLFVSVNVSPLQLRDRALPAIVRSILEETGLAPIRLEIELTESALIDNFERAQAILTDLKSTGVRLSLDDFGTGYSSLRHLQGLPLDKIKIDMSFVATMTSEVANRKIVAGVIGLGHSLGLPIVAEGVGDAAAAADLNLMGCDLAQGWLYGEAISGEEVTSMLKLPHWKRSPAQIQAMGNDP